MSTNCFIGYKDIDGKYYYSSCHWDGYIIGGVGEKLFNFYNTDSRAKRFKNRYDICSLGNTLDSSSFFSDDNKSWTKMIFSSVEECMEKDGKYVDYVYTYEDGQWWVDRFGHGFRYARRTIESELGISYSNTNLENSKNSLLEKIESLINSGVLFTVVPMKDDVIIKMPEGDTFLIFNKKSGKFIVG